MRRVMNYKKTDYYMLNELLKLHPGYSYINERKELESKVLSFFGERYITADTWYEIEKLIMLKENYYTQYRVTKIFGYSDMDKNSINNFFGILDTIVRPFKHNDINYYKKSEIDQIGSLGKLYSIYSGRNVISVLELVQYHNKNRIYHKGNLYISKYHIPFLYRKEELCEVNGDICILIGDAENPFEDFEKRCMNSNEMVYFDNYFGTISSKYESYKLMREFLILRINQSKSMKREQVATYITKLLYNLFELLPKEIFLLSENEVNSIIIQDSILGSNKDIIHFINFVKSRYKGFLSDVESYYVKANNSYDLNKKIYSPREFAYIYEEAINISRHVENAYNDDAYAQYWLYILFQLSDFTRRSDIFNMPILQLPYDYDWGYFCENEIKFHEAQAICSICELEAGNILIGKNMEHKRLYFLREQIPAIAVAIVICVGHAKKRNLRLLFSMKSVSSERVYNKLGEPFYGISNRKMNYTLATYFEAEGNESSEYRNEVYSLLTKMRSHKIKTPLSNSDTTAIYIAASNKDSSVEKISYHVTQRGAFGWLYHVMLNYIGEKFTSLEEETSRIIEINKRYSPMEMEELSAFIVKEKEERIEVLRVLNAIPKNNIKLFLSSFGTVGTFKNNQSLPCIFGHDCPRKGAECIYCEFSVKTTHAINVYCEEANKILDVLETTTDLVVIQKNMRLIYKILVVLKELKQEFGKDYMSVFIDMNSIKDRLVKLPKFHFNVLEELKNDTCTE